MNFYYTQSPCRVYSQVKDIGAVIGGFEIVEFRPPRVGDTYLNVGGFIHECADDTYTNDGARYILRKKKPRRWIVEEDLSSAQKIAYEVNYSVANNQSLNLGYLTGAGWVKMVEEIKSV